MLTHKIYTDNEIRAISNLYARYWRVNRPEPDWVTMPDGDKRTAARKLYYDKYNEVLEKSCKFVRLNLATEIEFMDEHNRIRNIPTTEFSDISERKNLYDTAQNKKENKLIWP